MKNSNNDSNARDLRKAIQDIVALQGQLRDYQGSTRNPHLGQAEEYLAAATCEIAEYLERARGHRLS